MNLPHGWLAESEARELARLAAGRVVLEMGAWKGRSTVVMSETAKYVISVDRHDGIEGHGESLFDYLENTRKLPNVALVIADFSHFVPSLQGIDMIYIDGDHDADSVRRDLGLALKNGAAVIAFHDWDFDEVRETAIEILGCEPNGLVGSVASYQL